jgi:hypothetical protein
MRHVNAIITALIFLIHILLMNYGSTRGVDFADGFVKEQSYLKAPYVCICLVLPP